QNIRLLKINKKILDYNLVFFGKNIVYYLFLKFIFNLEIIYQIGLIEKRIAGANKINAYGHPKDAPTIDDTNKINDMIAKTILNAFFIFKFPF
ncbi:MAG: hypothetical protein K2N40_01015, partial [Ureaplasma sp.]|nr:hypothetical protein [Ureaplasma sp.]